MFEIKENTFMQRGIVKYEDEHGNKAFFRREGERGFVGKLRFLDKSVKTSPLAVFVPIKENEKGQNLHVETDDGTKLERKDIVGGIDNFTILVQRWIDIMYEIYTLNNLSYIKEANPSFTDKEVWEKKIEEMSQYEELKNAINSIF